MSNEALKEKIAIENAELNEYIKQYLRFNNYSNTLDCFEAEINAQRMSTKLTNKTVLKDPDQIVEAPRLYSMLKDEK